MKKVDCNSVGCSVTQRQRIRDHFKGKKPEDLELFEQEDGGLLMKASGFEDLVIPRAEWGYTSTVAIDVIVIRI